MPTFTLLHTDDKLGLATAGDIVLTEAREVTTKEVVDILSERAVPLKDSAKQIRAVTTFTAGYELRDDSLVLPLGVDVGINDFRISAVRVQCSAEGYPTVSVTAVKPAAGSFAATPGTYGSLTVMGGFGIVNLFGATCTQPTESSCNISSQQAMAIAGTSGEILTEGMVLFAYRKDCSMAGYTEITIPVAGVETSADDNKVRAQFAGQAKSWVEYLIS